jgi:hypothetical protein
VDAGTTSAVQLRSLPAPGQRVGTAWGRSKPNMRQWALRRATRECGRISLVTPVML